MKSKNKFKNRIITRIVLMLMYVVIGIVMWSNGTFGANPNDTISSMGIAMAVCGAIMAVRNIIVIRDPEKLQKLETAETDERNVMLIQKSRSLAFAIYITAAVVAIIVMICTGMESESRIVAFTVCSLVVIYLISYLIMKIKH